MFSNWNTDDADLTDFNGFYRKFVLKHKISYYIDNHGYEQVYELNRLEIKERNIKLGHFAK